MGIQKCSNVFDSSDHLVEVRELWGLKYYVEVDPGIETTSHKQILQLKANRDSLRTDVFGGERDD